tara:strand:+ start:48 stop:710 length:663 start_codon:yes stop_codon:yes gene_type:complete
MNNIKKNKNVFNIWDIENSFYLKSDVSRLIKAISHFEAFKLSLNAKGSIVECGVFKGISLIRFLTYRNFYNQNKKIVYGFDAFGRFPKLKDKRDNNFAQKHDKKAGYGKSKKNLNKVLKKKKFNNFKLIKGDISKTIPIFLKKNKNFKISFLHLDLDVYNPTSFALNSLFKYVAPEGIILLDDYKSIKGATIAINEFVREKRLKLKTLKFNKKIKYITKK